MRERWTDDRMDDLNAKVDTLRGEMKAEFADVRTEMRTEFAAVRSEFKAVRAEMKAEHARAEDRADAMIDRLLSIQHQMLLFSVVVIGALIGAIAALVAVAIQL